jgi:colanic acid biosynthesis glycosyl transferase WcaI
MRERRALGASVPRLNLYSVPVPGPEPLPRLLVLNQYYHPGVEATAHLLTELCEALTADYHVTVITGRLRDRGDQPDYEIRNGVEIIRVRSTSFDRASIYGRAANYFTYLARALRRGLRADRPDVILSMTDPPLVGDVGYFVARRFRRPLVVISQDVFPEIAVNLGRLRQPLVIAALRALIAFYLRRADALVAIGPLMKERLIEKGAPADRISVVPNWVDVDAITPQSQVNPWSREQGLAGRFVVMHSGNVGHAQNLETLLRAVPQVDDLESLSVLIVGTGARYANTVALAAELGDERIQFLPYQPRERLSESLSSADVHYVGLASGLSGFVVPSRLYGVLAAGRPVLAAAEAESETAALVREIECGIVVPPDRPDLVAQTIRELAQGEHDLVAMGKRGRAYVESHASLQTAALRYREVLAHARHRRAPASR